ncbi:hypothetical protein [Aneurinibacillus aneurinilyticus]|uniref:hypothetical protein n=1 Tax=Aneurinibacillus aneurinilyticus TaxID=1391 RepID=UPI0023F891BD|nr:hypothetical protein [Aneurinibacillus aneurinilyticus]MCI1694300.1 hypothetical protein [Aneurinibacillus aneurinilyticus]
MEHGKRFVEEYPEIGVLFERIFIKRELDEWYKRKCTEEVQIPSEFNKIRAIKEIGVRNFVNPSSEIIIQIEDIQGEDGFLLEQQINIKVSKLIPVYILDFSYKLRHNLIDGIYEIVGMVESLELIQGANQIRRIMEEKGYIELSYLYDFYDTVYEWHELQDIKPFNRRFTLGEALFTDVLELC